jgi:hypothetical protein
MKHTKLLIIALAVFTLAYANITQSQIPVKLGGYFGLTFADVSINPTSPSSSRTGIIIGALGEIKFANAFFLEPRLQYIMKGTSESQANQTWTTKLNYLELCVLLKAKFPLTEFKPFITAGPTIGFKLSATQDYTGGNQSSSSDISSNVEGIDFGLNFGAGGEYALNQKVDIFAAFGYQLGLTNINKVAGSTTTYKNIGFQIISGVKFGL